MNRKVEMWGTFILYMRLFQGVTIRYPSVLKEMNGKEFKCSISTDRDLRTRESTRTIKKVAMPNTAKKYTMGDKNLNISE